MEEWISKKDLLKGTGISYGQLYRWKRERLIPDSWFEKRASFTGQETFFPRTLILERIYFILTHKDEYSFTEIKNLLAPDSASRSYTLQAVSALPNAARSALLYEAMHPGALLNHGQALTVAVCANYDALCHPDDTSLTKLMASLDAWQREKQIFSGNVGRLFVVRQGETSLPVFCASDAELWVPEDARVEYRITMNEVARTCTRMLNTIYEVK